MRILLIAVMTVLITTGAFAQVTITPNKVVYTRKNPTMEFKKTFEVVYPKVKTNLEYFPGERVERLLSYWDAYGTTLKNDMREEWATEMSYEVLYNSNKFLVVRLSRSGVGAYPSTYHKTIVISLDRSDKVFIEDLFKERIELLKKIDVRQTAEKAKAMSGENAEDLKFGFENSGKASDQVREFEISDYGVTFLYDWGFPHVALALEPEGRYFFSWEQLKPHLPEYGALSELAKKKPKPKEFVPIVGLGIGGLIGGVENGKFISADKLKQKAKGPFSYVKLDTNTASKQAMTNGYGKTLSIKVSKDQMDEVCPEFISLDVGNTRIQATGLGSNAKWNPIPRSIRSINKNNGLYRQVVKKILTSKGIKTAAKIDKIYRVDLDGDDVDEVVIQASNLNKTIDAKIGEYSLVLVRKIGVDGVNDILVGGEFVTSNDMLRYDHVINSIADLNGDGVMELVIQSSYYEGSDVTVLNVEGNTVMKRLVTGCGL